MEMVINSKCLKAGMVALSVVFVMAIFRDQYDLEPFSWTDPDPAGAAQEVKRSRKSEMPFAVGTTAKECDIFAGEWVYDAASEPLYKNEECPFSRISYSCQVHRRQDSEYEHWRWQPHGCSLPRFNGTLLLEQLRGKRVLYIGDSLCEGHYRSMLCMLHLTVGDRFTFGDQNLYGFSDLVFRAEDYNATFEFAWSPFLVDADYARHGPGTKIVKPESERNFPWTWQGVDLLVFNTYAWWVSDEIMKVDMSRKSEEEGEIIEMPREEAYRIVLKKMIGWIEENMDPLKTRVVLTGISPSHNNAMDWGGQPGRNCFGEQYPVPWKNFTGSGVLRQIATIIKEEIANSSKATIDYNDITDLSDYRRDAHVAVYHEEMKEGDLPQYKHSDCLHWCMPGVHDIWNELLYAIVFFPREDF